MMRSIAPCMVIALVISLVTLLGATAFAQDDAARAKEHYDEGAALYFKGKYADAVLAFMRAYEALPEPVFMYNIAMSHWRLGNIDKAVEAGERALRGGELAPDLHAQIAARVLVFHQLRHIEQTRWTPPADLGEADPIEEVAATQAAPPPENSHTLGWVGAGATVIGVGLLAGFGVMEVGLQNTIEEYELAASEGDAQRHAELKEEIESAQPLSFGLLVGGAGMVALGATLIAIDLVGGSESNTALLLSPGGVSARVTW